MKSLHYTLRNRKESKGVKMHSQFGKFSRWHRVFLPVEYKEQLSIQALQEDLEAEEIRIHVTELTMGYFAEASLFLLGVFSFSVSDLIHNYGKIYAIFPSAGESGSNGLSGLLCAFFNWYLQLWQGVYLMDLGVKFSFVIPKTICPGADWSHN